MSLASQKISKVGCYKGHCRALLKGAFVNHVHEILSITAAVVPAHHICEIRFQDILYRLLGQQQLKRLQRK